ncbi:MAG: SDR family oxidoreductase [bacterium]|nr:SDR family oxidoreductase [bacterium]
MADEEGTEELIDLSGKVALVTGAGAGIGREIARWLARAGCDVAVNDLDGDRAARGVAAVTAEGRRGLAVPADVRAPGAVESMVAAAIAGLGRLDVAVNNVGLMGDAPQSDFADLEAEDIRSVIDRNLVATILCCVAEAKALKEQAEGGVILNVSSGESTRPALRLAAYGAAKAGINHLTQTMATELGPDGIRVLSIAPGTTLTETVRPVFDDEHVARVVESLPLRRMTEPEELGRLAVFLASDLARCITGQFILADAGAWLSRTRPPISPGSAGA